VETRRGLFKKTLGSALLLAAAGAVPVALQKTRERAPRKALRFFTPAEYSVFAAVADRVLATSPLEPSSARFPRARPRRFLPRSRSPRKPTPSSRRSTLEAPRT